MEPMALGSPGNVSPGFMPTFLIGEMATVSASSIGQVGNEPGRASGTPLRNMRRVSFAPESPITSMSTNSPAMNSQSIYNQRLNMPPPGSKPETPQRKGPPIVSLSDTLPSLANQSLDQSSFVQSANQSAVFNQSSVLNQTNNSVLNYTGFNTSCVNDDAEEERDEFHLWVTVFGFPPSMIPAVLTWLSGCGSITVRHVPVSPRANWLHLRFSNGAEARRAIARHRHMLGPDTMIAVAPCTDKPVMLNWRQSAGDSFSEAGGTYLFSSQMTSSAVNNNTSFNVHTSFNTSMRSLAAGSPDIGVELSMLPRRSTGVVSKAMDYFFGW